MTHSLAAYLIEWASGSGKESYLDVFIATGELRHRRSHNAIRTPAGKALRAHLFGSQRAPSSSVVRAAIHSHGSAEALAAKLGPIIAQGMNAPFGALSAVLHSVKRRPSSANGPVTIRFSEKMLTFVPVDGFITFEDSPEAQTTRGVYLWCIDYEDRLLANYVGKTWNQGGFRARLRQEISDYRAGKYCSPVDVDSFKRGVRRQLPGEMSPAQLKREILEIVPLYRIVLVPLSSDEESKLVESTFVRRIREDPATFQFLCNCTLGERVSVASN